MAARIAHPNVAPIYNAGEDRGLLFIAMRLLRGGNLESRVLALRTLPLPDVVSVVGQLASALDASHASELVHRDVKPSNVLFDEGDDLHAYLTDFGIALDSRDASGGTTDQALGTPLYRAPEQANGGDVGSWTDIYALACVAVFCLTGAPPYPASTEEEASAAHQDALPPLVSERCPWLPSDLDAVVAWGIAKKPDRRPATASEFAAALECAAGAENTGVGATTAPRPSEPNEDDATRPPTD
jgi:serine/threonine-protein kinase